MKVVFIGSGNVATHMATELHKYDFDIVQVYSRTLESAENLAKQVKAIATTDIKSIIDNADLYIFSVKDSVLTDVASQISSNKGLWVHTAGSMQLETLSAYSSRYGVIYPFQTFTKNRDVEWKNVPIFIEASDQTDLQLLFALSRQLSDKVAELPSSKRKYVHLTGVFACNFVNHMYTLSEHFLKEADLPFDVTLPLIDETCSKIHTIDPKDAQTGPAVRFDENVIKKHLDLIDDKGIKEIYRLISESIHKG